ncbi:MAG: iron-containing alcohol dehydrogenase PsrA [Kiloniellales bacterium]
MWTYANPVKVHFGPGAVDGVADVLSGRPYAIVTYHEVLFHEIAARIASRAGQPAVVIDGIAPNPDYPMLHAACRQFATAKDMPGVILALGGGSVIDAAKVIAAGAGGFAPVQAYLEGSVDVGALTAVPIVAVPTTAGTGSEVTSWATVWDRESGRKRSLAHQSLYPTDAVVDPDLMTGMPGGLTISTALDALSHSLEAIWNVNANPVSTNHAVFAACELLECLPRLVEDLDNRTLRMRIARAALLAGLAFSNTKTTLAHSISYPITLRHDMPHGFACSFSLAMVMRSVIGVSPDCDEALRRIFGRDLHSGASRLERFLVGLGVSVRPADHGIAGDEWQSIVMDAIGGERGRNFIGSRERIVDSLIAGGGRGA